MTITDENPFDEVFGTAADGGEDEYDGSPEVVNGRYRITDPDDPSRTRRCTRTSTFADTLQDDTYHLDAWQDRVLAKGLSMRPDLVQLAAAHDPNEREDREVFRDLVARARDTGGGNVGSDYGTAVHRQTERVDAGQEMDEGTSEQIFTATLSYQMALETYGLKPVPGWTERYVWNRDLNLVGRLDRALYVSDPALLGLDGDPFYAIGDCKTQKQVWPGDKHISIQLAVYAHCDKVWNAEARRWDDPDIELSHSHGIVMHVPSTGTDAFIRRFDLTKGWTYALLSKQVRDARNDKKLDVLVGSASASKWMCGIVRASTTKELSRIWKEATDAGEWNDDLLAAGIQRQAELETNG